MKINSEKIDSNHNGARSQEDIRFFRELAEDLEKDYHLEVHEEIEHLVLKIGSKDIYVPKKRKIPMLDKDDLVKIEDVIKEVLENNNVKKRDKKEAA